MGIMWTVIIQFMGCTETASNTLDAYAINANEIAKPNAKPEDCGTCHGQTKPIKKTGVAFDTEGIYPKIPSKKFRKGNAFPVLIESIEHATHTSEKTCTSCHQAHGKKTKGLDNSIRKKNLGMWITLHRVNNLLDVEIKFKSFEATHRIPGGIASRAYIIVVNVEENGTEIPLWFGPKLPKELRTKEKNAGILMAKYFINKNGKLTSDLKKATALIDDTRLEHGRFIGEHFIYAIHAPSTINVKATLYYLRDFPSWKSSSKVFQKEAELDITLNPFGNASFR